MKRIFLAGLFGVALVSFGLAQTKVQPSVDQLMQIKQALSPFENVKTAEVAGYKPFMDCMSGPQGGQGYHYVNSTLLDDPKLDPFKPEALMYEKTATGSLKLTGVEYLVIQKTWHDAGNKPAPVLLGREFYLNTTLLDQPFYGLHLWLWQYNPLDVFANWNPLVTCPNVK